MYIAFPKLYFFQNFPCHPVVYLLLSVLLVHFQALPKLVIFLLVLIIKNLKLSSLGFLCMMVCNQISPSCTNLGWGLTDKGVVTVSLDQIDVYCDQGCYAHTMAVRKCINDVKRDFWFATRAHVQYVSDTISKGCSARKGTISYYCNIPLVRFCFITYDVDLY